MTEAGHVRRPAHHRLVRRAGRRHLGTVRRQGRAAGDADESRRRIQLKSANDVKKEADAINARAGGWAYKLQTYKLETLRRKLEDLLEQKAS